MSDDLVKRLRNGDTVMANHYMDEAADRIEELEAEVDYLRRWQNAAFWANPNIDIDIDKCPEAQEELKGKADE